LKTKIEASDRQRHVDGRKLGKLFRHLKIAFLIHDGNVFKANTLATVTIALALAILGSATEIGSFLFLSCRSRWPKQVQSCVVIIEIGLEQAPFFSSFEHVKSLQIMGPNNTKNSSKSVIFSYLTINNIVRVLF
jgi:hypothetical protein